MKNRLQRARSDVLSRHELPRTADEIDLDRLVWDPDYRRAVRPLLVGDREKDRGDTAAKDALHKT